MRYFNKNKKNQFSRKNYNNLFRNKSKKQNEITLSF